MTTNYLAVSLTRLATLINTKSMSRARNRALIDPTSLNNNGIQIHGRLILQFFTTIIDGVQGVLVTGAHPTKSMPMILIEYLVLIMNDGILAIVVENGFFYNKVHTKPIEALKKKLLQWL